MSYYAPNLIIKLAGNLFAHEKMWFVASVIVNFVINAIPNGQALLIQIVWFTIAPQW